MLPKFAGIPRIQPELVEFSIFVKCWIFTKLSDGSYLSNVINKFQQKTNEPIWQMLRTLVKFERKDALSHCKFFEFGAVQEDACPKRFSWFFYWIPKVQESVNLVDLKKAANHVLICKKSVSITENRPYKV